MKGNVEYTDWLRRTENVFFHETGLLLSDYPHPWRKNYDAGLTPRQAAVEVMVIHKLQKRGDE